MTSSYPDLNTAGKEAFESLERVLAHHEPKLSTHEVGTVARVANGIAEVTGFTNVNDSELIAFPGGLLGIAANLNQDRVGIILFGGEGLRVGHEARRTHRVVDVPVGDALLGRVVDALGRPLDENGPIKAAQRWPIERPAPAIISRAPVVEPLQTGIKAIDAAIPIGLGQRELILGDRQTGKTSIAVDTIINQRDSDVVCVYCSIGQRSSSLARVIAELNKHDVLKKSVVVAVAGEQSAGLQFAAPYAATSIAEYFMEQGRDVLIVYDDLTRHARAYRELSLLLRRPPGREAYPGDIFFIHSRLLERATHLREELGGGSLTALPVIETQAQNISAYIPTNLISITDGQIYLSPDLFQKGQLPAIDIGKSVSRVGGKAQNPAFRAVTADLKLSYAQFEELETFARFGTRLDDQTRRDLERGRRVREILKQPEHALLSVAEQVAVLLATTKGFFDSIGLDHIADAEAQVIRTVVQELPKLCRQIEAGDPLTEADETAILSVIRQALQNQVPIEEP